MVVSSRRTDFHLHRLAFGLQANMGAENDAGFDAVSIARQSRKNFSWFFFVFAILWTLVSFLGTYVQYMTATNALRAGRYSIVEGPVTHFVPMPYSGHSEESFVVGGQKFSYSDYIVTAGFHNTASHGGPIHEGLQVRVTYVGDVILKLEIAE